ncbi:TPA: restriction endonuclease subunit S [Campylobacter upsaliensis]|nr:restriction endonuclease subunit S [Campylobacter upsaliensis]
MKKHTQSPCERSEISYKPSGIEWLGEIPQSWENVSIRSCFTESNQRCNTDSYPLLSVTIANGIIYQDNIENKKDISNDDKSNYKIVPLNAVAYNKMRMWQGAVGVNTLTTGIVSPAYIVAIPNEKILPNFVSYLFKSKIMIGEFDKNSYGLCLDMNNLRYDDFRNIKIPLPPLQEQKEIAEFLDKKCEKIQNYINKKQKLITLLQEKKQALINEVITKGLNPNIEFKNSGIEWLGEIPKHWEVKKIKYIYKSINGFTPDTSNASYYDNFNGYDWITISDINKKYVNESEVKVSQKYIDKFHPQVTPKGSLLYSFKLSVGLVAFAKKDIYTNEAVLSFLNTNDVDLNFLYYSSFLIQFNAKENIYGAKLLNKELINNAFMVFPPLQEQKEIAEFLDSKVAQINSVIEKTKKQIELVKEYKNTLINEAVCGRINLERK